MASILFRAFCFLFMIMLSYALKKVGVLRMEDGKALARVVLNITLPCALIVGFRSFVFDVRFLVIPLLSLCVCVAMVLLGMAIARKRRTESIFYMLSLSGYNIGNFVLPFVSGLLGAGGVAAVCLFDVGNAMMCMGFNVLLVSLVISDSARPSLAKALLSLFKKPSFTVYVVMIVLAALDLHLPSAVFELAESISPANGPLAMMMIGLMLEFSSKKEHVAKVALVCGLRLAMATAASFLFYRFAPFDDVVRRSIAVAAFAPISSAAPAFTADFRGDTELAGLANSVSIVMAMIFIPLLLVAL